MDRVRFFAFAHEKISPVALASGVAVRDCERNLHPHPGPVLQEDAGTVLLCAVEAPNPFPEHEQGSR